MSNYVLPEVREKSVPQLLHFPTQFQAVVFRLWETVRVEKIAYALDAPVWLVQKTAEDMGLPPQKYVEAWEDRGYITTIRNVWNILPYEQILKALDVSEEKLAEILKNDDFLDIKLGNCKPECQKVVYQELNECQHKKTLEIKSIITTNFSDLFDGAKPFAFFDEPVKRKDVIKKCSEKIQDTSIYMSYSFCGLYSNALEEDTSISYPDALLEKYSNIGVNTIWVPAILYQLIEFPFDASLSLGWQKRQEKLNNLVSRAAKYGIKVLLYFNEPRNLPLAFFDEFPELKGRTKKDCASMCVSDRRVLDYLRDAMASLFTNVPGLGGFYTINFSENLTHCKSSTVGEECPKCKDVEPQKLAADVINAMAEGAWSVDASAKVIVYAWAWERFMTTAQIEELIESLPKEVVINSVSETLKEFSIGGVSGQIRDYSLSIPGPGEISQQIWQYARNTGHAVCAKVQVNNSWECSVVPYMPVYDLIREHMRNLSENGVEHIMLNWTLGGYPSFGMKLAISCLRDGSEENYDRLLSEEYGELAPAVKSASKKFSKAFKEFPFNVATLYYGPQNAGPSNLLYRTPTGLKPTMTCYAYDDLEGWRSIYPIDIFEDQFKKLSEMWREGLKDIADFPQCSFKDAALCAYYIFYSSYLQIRYNRIRETGEKMDIIHILQEEKKVALGMYELMQHNSCIGYEAANHYYFNKGMLMEKVLCCEHLLEVYKGEF